MAVNRGVNLNGGAENWQAVTAGSTTDTTDDCEFRVLTAAGNTPNKRQTITALKRLRDWLVSGQSSWPD